MLAVAARIPDAAARDQFADRLAHQARITEDVVRAEIRKAAGARKTTVSPHRFLRRVAPLKPAERGLLWGLVHDPESGRAALEELDEEDLRLWGPHRCSKWPGACTIVVGGIPNRPPGASK